MEIGTKKSWPFIYLLIVNICAILLLGWQFTGGTTGYGVIGLWRGASFILAALFQILSLWAILAMVIICIWSWLACEGKVKPLKFGKWGMKAVVELIYFIYMLLVIFVFIFLAVGCNGVTFGLFLYFVINMAAFITYLVMLKKGIIARNGLLTDAKIFSKNTKSKDEENVEESEQQEEEKQQDE